MTATDAHRDRTEDADAVSVELVASAPQPGPMLAALRAARTTCLPDGRWIVSERAAAEQVLGGTATAVPFEAAEDDPVQGVQALMARFSDEPAHRRRREVATAALEVLDVTELRGQSRRLTLAQIAGAGQVDVMALARRIPVLALAGSLGAPDPDLALRAITLLCRRLAPRLDDAPRPPAAAVHRHLESAFGALDEVVVNRLALLFQTLDATAALIGVAADHLLRAPDPASAVAVADLERVDQLEPAVQLTTRRAVRDLRLSDGTIPAGSEVVVCLAAATSPGAGSLSFGFGPHACPGRAAALALASGVLDALASRGATVAGTMRYEPRPNLRMPVGATARFPPGQTGEEDIA